MKKLTKFAQVAALGLALAFTFSCSSDDDNGGGGGGGDKGNDIKNYKTVVIGTQTWMAENLNYRGTEPDTLGSCYDNDPAKCKTYGRLYGWRDAIKACPSGWHLPSRAEWDTLMTTTGKSPTTLKAKSGWSKDGQPTNGTDDYGFSALPGGYWRSGDSGFQSIGSNGGWWSSDERSDLSGDYGEVSYLAIGSNISHYNTRKGALLSVRCIKD